MFVDELLFFFLLYTYFFFFPHLFYIQEDRTWSLIFVLFFICFLLFYFSDILLLIYCFTLLSFVQVTIIQTSFHFVCFNALLFLYLHSKHLSSYNLQFLISVLLKVFIFTAIFCIKYESLRCVIHLRFIIVLRLDRWLRCKILIRIMLMICTKLLVSSNILQILLYYQRVYIKLYVTQVYKHSRYVGLVTHFLLHFPLSSSMPSVLPLGYSHPQFSFQDILIVLLPQFPEFEYLFRSEHCFFYLVEYNYIYSTV